jgi:hypothetical protein
MKKANKKKKRITAEELDALHDAGADISEYLDLSSTRRPGMEIRRINVDFPTWMIEQMDREAERLGVTRQSIIKVWIAERLSASDKKIARKIDWRCPRLNQVNLISTSATPSAVPSPSATASSCATGGR